MRMPEICKNSNTFFFLLRNCIKVRQMKKIILVLFLLAVNASFVHAQELDYERAYSDYLFKLEQYKSEHGEYVLAMASYLKSKTLTLQTKAEKETLEMLKSRDDVVATYLTAIRTKLQETSGLGKEEKDEVFLLLDTELKWYLDHKARMNEGDFLEDLVSKSLEAKTRYEIESKIAIYKALFTISKGESKFVRSRQEEILLEVKNKVEMIKNEGFKETAIIERWFRDIEERFEQSKNLELAAEEVMAKLTPKERNKDRVYQSGIGDIEGSLNKLKEVNDFLGEIVREIKR